MKEGQVRALLDEFIKDAEFETIRESPREQEYRNKMEFSFGDLYKDGPLSLGMHKRGSFYDIVTVTDCQIVDSDFREILAATLHYFREKNIGYFHRMRHTGYLRHLLVRKAVKTGEILVDLVTTTQDWQCMKEKGQPAPEKGICPFAGTVSVQEEERLLHGWRDCLLSLSLKGNIRGILHTKNDSVADMIKNEGTDTLFGDDFFYEELLGLRFKISPFSFFQTNSLGAEVLYSTVRDYILGDSQDCLNDKVVYDLYSGTGTIAQILAPVSRRVVGVEIVEEAVQAARENAALNGLGNCEFLAGDVLKTLDEIEVKPDYIVLDPPRDGIHPKTLGKILAYGVERMIYISCKPTSLARDLAGFREAGYEVVKGVCVDMFPGAYHVETVVMLSHKKPDSVINVKVEFGEGEGKVPLDNIAKRAAAYKPKERVTYKMIKEYIEAKYGFKVHTAYIAEVKRDLGLPMYDAPNAVEELKQPRKHPTAEKAEAIKDALKHFEVI